MSAFTPRPAADVNTTAEGVLPITPGQEDPPWWKPLRSSFNFFMVPALIVLVPQLFGSSLPVPALYLLAAGCGLVLAIRALSDPELVLASFILYLPFTLTYAAAIAPGVNGTNVLYALLILTWIAKKVRENKPFFTPMPFTKLVKIWAFLSLTSVLTAMSTMGPSFITGDKLPDIKAWCDQFFVFFVVLNLIRNGAAARRMTVYMMVGLLLVLFSGFTEWLEKRHYDSIEKARLLGPQDQPNDFSAFIVYGFGVPGALIICNMWRLRTWLWAMPLLLVTARVLLATYSRGGQIGLGAMLAGLLLVRGRVLFATIAVVGTILVQAVPEVLPSSMSARMSQTTSEEGGELDKSSQTRLILWEAAIAITLDNPILGTGFLTFPEIKDQYTATPVHESDNHNMFLFICSQMGLPALIVFLLIFARLAYVGASLHKHALHPYDKVIGLGGVGLAAGVIGVNMFGSRMTDTVVMGYVWITIAVISHLWREQQARITGPAEQPDQMMR
jgi:putative inorganic carbon (hco3(-)) transporter